MTQAEIQQYVYDFFIDKGLPHITVCAIMGNITAESAWNVDAIENGSEIGFGLCQWSFGRREQLEAYGITLNHQCEFLWAELSGDISVATTAEYQWIEDPADSVDNGEGFTFYNDMFLSGDGDISTLTKAFCYCWERPAYETNHLADTRIPSAFHFYETMKYKGKETPVKEKSKFNFILYNSKKRRNQAVWKNRIFYRK